MQTFKRLPTIVPKAKKTTDQKWNGTAAQIWGSNMRCKVSDPDDLLKSGHGF
jgi:hypothetical protein